MYVIKINLPLSFYFFFNVATIEFSVLYVARIVFLLDSAALGDPKSINLSFCLKDPFVCLGESD